MGRGAVVSYSDQNTKVLPASSGASGEGQNPKKLVVNKVTNYLSSIAGSNSSDFDVYVAGRRRERDRIAQLEAEARKEEEHAICAARAEKYQMEIDAKTAKNAAKRKRKKENAKKNKKLRKLSSTDADDLYSDSESEEVTQNMEENRKSEID